MAESSKRFSQRIASKKPGVDSVTRSLAGVKMTLEVDTPSKKRSSDVSLCSYQQKRSSSTSSDRALNVVADVRGNLMEFFTDNDEVVVQATKVATKVPTAVWFDVNENVKLMSTALPDADMAVIMNVAAGFSKTGKDYINSKEGLNRSSKIDSSRLSFKGAHTFQAKGARAKASEFDRTLPQPLDSSEAQELWGGETMWNSCMKLHGMEDAMVTLQPYVASCKKCFFDYKVVATKRSVSGILKPDVVIKLKGSTVEQSSVGGILSLHSLGQGTHFDCDYSVGQLITYGQEFLNKIPERPSVVLGITDLKNICWFRLTRCGIDDADVTLGGFKVGRSNVTSAVKESIGGILRAEPASLGLQMKWTTDLPEGWAITGYLGSGKTSNVYKVVCGDGRERALKVFRSGYEKQGDDIQFLNLLQAVDGVPRVFKCLENSMLVLEPVGVPFEASQIGKGGLSLAGLVDVLQSAHASKIVHKDIRLENIMIAQSLQEGEGRRLFIIDWGFAEKICKFGNLRGSITTASDDVLQQYMKGANRLEYTAADDLTSLVRCIFLVLNPSAEAKLDKLGKDPAAIFEFWSNLDGNEIWEFAHEAAAKMEYDALKKAFEDIEQVATTLIAQ